LFKDNNKVYTVFEGNIEFHWEETGGWMLIKECLDKDVEGEGFCLFLVVTLI